MDVKEIDQHLETIGEHLAAESMGGNEEKAVKAFTALFGGIVKRFHSIADSLEHLAAHPSLPPRSPADGKTATAVPIAG